MTPIRKPLLAWYDATARDLPWRRSGDPYAIWVSEIMLQQTRVETVIPFYERFLEKYPTVETLAQARENAVLATWSGLGYYRRARLLHAGACEVVARYGGKLPRDAAARRGLPGIGRYTAGAIGSIAFGLEEPVVDGNVARVLSRVFMVSGPPAARVRERWRLATELVAGERPGHLNQALMELGATLCASRAPDCPRCPIVEQCAAFGAGRVEEFPGKRPRAAPTGLALTAVVASDATGRRVWLTRAPEELFGGMWLVPMAKTRDARAVLRAAGLTPLVIERGVRKLEHVLSHRILRVRVVRAQVAPASSTRVRRLVALSRLAHLGVPALTHKILSAVGLHGDGPARRKGKQVRGVREPLSVGVQRRRKD